MTRKNTRITTEQRLAIKAEYEEARARNKERGLIKELAERYNISRWTVRDVIIASGKINQEAFEGLEDPSHLIKGKSILYDAAGKIKLQWVKTDKKVDVEAMKSIVEDICADVPALPPTAPPPKKFRNADLLTVYPMGDPHFGLYAWAEEAGDDFDLTIAEADLCDAMRRLVDSAPPSDEALIINLGDFFEADNMQGETMRSKHKLDTDTRWLKVLRTGVRALITCIQAALTKHQKVTVICAIGNHDDHSSMFLMTLLSHLFEKEKRIHIIDAPTIKHYFHWESILIGVHHGHTIKMKDLVAQMPYDRPKEFYASKHRYWWTGHIHQDRKIEEQAVLVESARTLAARNAWAASNGYRSGRDAKAVVYHKDFGEIERHTVSVEMLRALRKK